MQGVSHGAAGIRESDQAMRHAVVVDLVNLLIVEMNGTSLAKAELLQNRVIALENDIDYCLVDSHGIKDPRRWRRFGGQQVLGSPGSRDKVRLPPLPGNLIAIS